MSTNPLAAYISFTGQTGCYAELPLAVLAGATTFTIEAKISTVSTKSSSNNWTWGTIAGREIDYNWQDDFGLCVNGGKLCFWAEPKNKTTTTANNTISTAVVNDGLIHKVAVVSSNGAIDLYCDGVLVAHTNNVNAKITNSATILLAFDSHSASYLQMDLYEARFWSVARTQAELFADIDGAESGLECWLKPTAEGLLDYSGNGRHATLYGNPACNVIYSLPITQQVDVERIIQNTIAVSLTVDVERQLKTKWRYVNMGDVHDLTQTPTYLTDLPATKSTTGYAFYQTTRAKCFDLPATPQIWAKFDVYFDGSNRWRAYNGGSNGFTGITTQTDGRLGFFSNNTSQQHISNICKTNQLQTVLLHMVSGTNGLIEAWVDGTKIYTYNGDVNHGDDFADFYLQSDGAGTFFSNVIISNIEIGLNDGWQKISVDAERQIKKPIQITLDVQRNFIPAIVVPLIGSHFNHLVASLTIPSGASKRIVLPKRSVAYIRGTGIGTIKVSSDTDATGTVTGAEAFNAGEMYAELGECETVRIAVDSTTVTPQQIIKAFVSSLTKTTLQGTAAVDEAINYVTQGRIETTTDLVNAFLNDLANANSETIFLRDKCGIILGNADTGAITGSDAGGDTIKTASSVIPEQIPVTSWGIPTIGSTTTINGLTVHWASIGANGNELSETEEHILAGLNSDWIEQCLNLIDESFGINFYGENTILRDINVRFEDNENHALAYVKSYYSNSQLTRLDLVVNMHYYNDLDTTSEDGLLISSSPLYDSAGYLDRTLAHEFTHAVMAANIDNFSSLPLYITEGMAELVHGIDDLRGGDIVNLALDKAELSLIFSTGGTTSNAYPYSAGYMLLRYLAKQAADISFTPNEINITNLLISDGATNSNYEALTDNTRQILYSDVSRTLIKTLSLINNVEILDVIPTEVNLNVRRALISKITVHETNTNQHSEQQNNSNSKFLNFQTKKSASGNILSADETDNNEEEDETGNILLTEGTNNDDVGIQRIELHVAEQQLTDTLKLVVTKSFMKLKGLELDAEVAIRYLDYKATFVVTRIQQIGNSCYIELCTDVDLLLYTQFKIGLPSAGSKDELEEIINESLSAGGTGSTETSNSYSDNNRLRLYKKMSSNPKTLMIDNAYDESENDENDESDESDESDILNKLLYGQDEEPQKVDDILQDNRPPQDNIGDIEGNDGEWKYKKATEIIKYITQMLGRKQGENEYYENFVPALRFKEGESDTDDAGAFYCEKNNITYRDLMNDILSWSARVPNRMLNACFAGNKMIVVQRGIEPNQVSLDSGKFKLNEPEEIESDDSLEKLEIDEQIIITEEKVRTIWGSTPWSKTVIHETPRTVLKSKNQKEEPEPPAPLMLPEQPNFVGISGLTEFPKLEKPPALPELPQRPSGGKTNYIQDSDEAHKEKETKTKTKFEYTDDDLVKRSETLLENKDGITKTITEYYYETLPTGRKFLAQEITWKYEGETLLYLPLVEKTTIDHTPLMQGQGHVVSSDEDGDIHSTTVGQVNPDVRVSKYLENKWYEDWLRYAKDKMDILLEIGELIDEWATSNHEAGQAWLEENQTAIDLLSEEYREELETYWNERDNRIQTYSDDFKNYAEEEREYILAQAPDIETTTDKESVTIQGLLLYDSSFPIHDEQTLKTITESLTELNNSKKTTVQVIVFGYVHAITLLDQITFQGEKYNVISNVIMSTPDTINEQHLTLVKWETPSESNGS